MLIGVLGLGAAGSYALFPTLAGKARFRLRPRRREPVLYLTFDDGPDPAHTPALLDLLARHHVKATFFLVSGQAKAHPDLIARMQREGHTLGFHSARHRSPYLLSPRETERDFARGLADLASLGLSVTLFRPPWGVMNLPSFRQVRRRGLTVARWDVMAQDWAVPWEEIIRRLRRRTRPGDVICLHDGRGKPGAPAETIRALSVLLPEWQAQGYAFQTLEGLYEKP